MVFDYKISTTISLSKTLDVFLEDNEKPSTILYFLKEHEDKFLDIVKFSDHSPRLFSIDFLRKCSLREKKLFESFLSEDNINEEISLFIWSIFCCNGVPNDTKSIFKKHFDWLRDKAKLSHLHGGRTGRTIYEVDKVLCEYSHEPFNYADAINSLDYDIVVEWSKNFQRSLYAFRIFQ